jgi:plasmid maintenance system antidote protein VapI
LWDLAAGAALVELEAAGAAALFGASAAIETAAKAKLTKAVVIRVADLFMISPKRWVILQRREEYAVFTALNFR